MDYSKSLLEFIKSKGEIERSDNVCVSLEDIAKLWNQTILLAKFLRAESEKNSYMDKEFIKNVSLTLKNLEDKNFIEKIIYSKEYIKFSLFYRENWENPAAENSPLASNRNETPRRRRGRENSVSPENSEFEKFLIAPYT